MMSPIADYALPLRAIGQALEVLHVESFDVEVEGDDYLVRARTKRSPREKIPRQGVPGSVVRIEQEESSRMGSSPVTFQLRYTPEDIERLEQEGQARRRSPKKKADGHSMSQLLRAAGGYVNQKGARFKALSWRDESVAIVYETIQGRRELDAFRLDVMYDFWVRMSIRKAAAAS
jgi:hypothetical protein